METLDPVMPEAAVQPVDPADAAPVTHGLEFVGSAAEYFRIWIVNLALTLVTLGIYSAWAKVRRQKYLYGQTRLAGSSFGYHGDPVKILKGRALAVLLLFAYSASGQLHPVAGLVAALLLMLALPWLVVKAMRFRMRMTSWRGIHFDFKQDFAGAFKAYTGWGILAVVSLGLAWPQFVRKRHLFAVNNTRFGAADFECDAPTGPFYKAALKAFGIALVVALVFALYIGMSGVLSQPGPPDGFRMALLQLVPLAIVFLVYFLAYGTFQAGVLNAVYNHSRIGPHRFRSSLGAARLTGLYVTNLLAILGTLGLLLPWATVRLLKYRLQTLELESHGSLDLFVAGQATAQPGAAGEEISEFFDVDLGL